MGTQSLEADKDGDWEPLSFLNLWGLRFGSGTEDVLYGRVRARY